MKKLLNPKKVVLGMSGGVDSSIALMLLKNKGYEVVGVSLRYDTWGCRRENVCCSEKSFEMARKIAAAFGAQYEQFDVRELFSREVIGYFRKELGQNRTPSPCVFCNPNVKIFSLLKIADRLDAKYVATGHYARVKETNLFGKKQLALLRGRDKKKDQSYSLSFIRHDQLERLIFPLGDLEKEEVYRLARKNREFDMYRLVKQSQDFCFISQDDLPKFIKENIGLRKGKIIDINSAELGEHEGLPLYTIGQRKGIGLSGGPYYVVDKKTSTNQFVVSKNKSDAYKQRADLKPYNLIVKPDTNELDVMIKTRSSERLQKARLQITKEKLTINFSKPNTILTPGQIAVFYIGNVCIGAGVIGA